MAKKVALQIVPLQQGRVSGDVRLLGAENIGSGFGRRSLKRHQASTLPRRWVCCRALVSGGSARVAGRRFSRSRPVSGCYLSFMEREEIAVLLARGSGVREIARQLGRAPSTISRELQRNAAIRTGRPEYRASTAQTMPTVALDDRSRRSSLSTRSCVAMCRTARRVCAAARRERRGSAGRLGGAASRTAKGPALGTVLELGADRWSATR